MAMCVAGMANVIGTLDMPPRLMTTIKAANRIRAGTPNSAAIFDFSFAPVGSRVEWRSAGRER